MGQSAHSIHGAPPDGEAQLGLPPGLTTHRFLAQLPSTVQVLHDAGDTPLRWVETSELTDPTPYLMDHELLLTAGLPFLGDGAAGEAVDGFVQRLSEARVSALAFGLEPHFREVPPALLDACRRHGLTLWQLPDTLPFAAVGVTFSRLLESVSASVLRQVADANRQLMRAVRGEYGEEELLRNLVQRIPGSVYLYGVQGELRLQSGRSGTAHAEDQAGALALELLSGSGPRVELRESPDGFLQALPLRGASRTKPASAPTSQTPTARRLQRPEPTLGALVLLTKQRLTAPENSILSTAVGLLELLARQRAAGSLSPGQLATLLLLGGDSGTDDGVLSRLLADSTPGSGTALRVVAARSHAEEPSEAPAEILAWRRLWDTKLVAHDGGLVLAVTRQEPSPSRLARVEAEGYACAVSRPAPGPATVHTLASQARREIPSLRHEVLALLPRVDEEHRSLLAEQEPRTFARLLPRGAGAGLARELLGPLLELEAARRDLLLRVLRAWLAAHGSWDGASNALGIHRNSVRRHISAVGEVLGKELADPSVRTELWLALQFLEPENVRTSSEQGREASAGPTQPSLRK
ncbi:PucR family transcriptional regulator [Arthrobacter sp. NPDC090010]|uniref:PucR family transcriptional regulator n=1 Tax=Arthrobacter sp. NPDC090010 TaxID=3363942 RepID=UPI00380023EF